MKPIDVAHARIIERFELAHGKATIGAGGKDFKVTFDDVLDLAQAVEMIMLKLTRKLLRKHCRPKIHNRAALKHTALVGGDYSMGSDTAPLPALQVCDVTERLMHTHYLRIAIDGNAWEQWFCRLDELIQALYVVIKDAQADPYQPTPTTKRAARTLATVH